MPNAEWRMPKGTALVTAIALATALSIGHAEIIDRVLAVVNGVLLTQTDLYGAIAFGLVDVGDGDPIGPALDQLIERELVLAEVNRYAPPEPSEAEIAARETAVRARFPSPEAFQRALISTGYTEERVRLAVRDGLRIESYLDQRFGIQQEPAERQALIADWKAGLRRRADVTIQLRPVPRSSARAARSPAH
jgi:hypothetical protein